MKAIVYKASNDELKKEVNISTLEDLLLILDTFNEERTKELKAQGRIFEGNTTTDIMVWRSDNDPQVLKIQFHDGYVE